MKPRLIAIVGPTSSGKTSLGLAIATLFAGEIVNADSRQWYRDLTIGTGKPTGRSEERNGERVYLVDSIPHHLMDALDPQEVTSVTTWRANATEVITGIQSRGHLPLVVGGTGLYVQALLDAYIPPSLAPQFAWRQEQSKQPLSELVERLQLIDPASSTIIDLKNPRRVLRALEVAEFTGASFVGQRQQGESPYQALRIGLKVPREELYQRIETTIDRMFTAGWIEEVRTLHSRGIPYEAPGFTSLGYREIVSFLQNKITQNELRAMIVRATQQYAKRQETWFKKDTQIKWVTTLTEAQVCIGAWLSEGE